MRPVEDLEEAKARRKKIKPQVEKRRRERINRSLENLKTILLPQVEENRRRVEKAEILEHTVLFLHNTRAAGGDGGHNHTFQDGFSSCLQRAAHFLGPEGKRLWLRDAPETMRLRAAAHCSSSASLLRKSSRSMLQMLIRKSDHRTPSASVATGGPPRRESGGGPTASQQPRKDAPPSPPHCVLLGQALWRPWP